MPIRKICILGLDDYAMLAGQADANASGYVGGESVQHILLARAWRDMGLDVSVIVYDHGQPRVSLIDGIRAIAAYRPEAGIPVLRFMHPRLTKVLAAMREADADVYYQSPSSMYTGLTAWFARRHGKRSVARIASDLGCIPGRQLIRYRRDRWLYEYGLRHASLIAAQTTHQQGLLRQHYGLSSDLVNMVVEEPGSAEAAAQDIDVLWLANPRTVKRPELLLELARLLPHRRFTLAGGPLPGIDAYYEGVCRAASAVPNVTMTGAVPYRHTGALMSRARLHVNTSSAEGFPNTFLQAWIRGVPVVSFFDPDGVIRKYGLGCAAGTLREMADAVEARLVDETLRREESVRARAFMRDTFEAGAVARRYIELLGNGAPARSGVTRSDSLETAERQHAPV